MDKCDECIHARFKRGTSRGVMDCDPDEYWCDVDQEEYFCADETEFDIDCPDFNNINYVFKLNVADFSYICEFEI